MSVTKRPVSARGTSPLPHITSRAIAAGCRNRARTTASGDPEGPHTTSGRALSPRSVRYVTACAFGLQRRDKLPIAPLSQPLPERLTEQMTPVISHQSLILLAGVLGGFNRSSQHLEEEVAMNRRALCGAPLEDQLNTSAG
jgi:hypothetical protein